MHFKYLIIPTIIITLVTGCFHKGQASASHDTIRIALDGEVPTLDPALAEDAVSTRAVFDLFDGLISFDQHDNPIPGMAESYEISKDGKTYTFYLRQGLKFSDGSPIAASDFVYSWQRLVDPKTASNYNFILSNVVNGTAIINGKLSPQSLGVSATNPLTFIVHLVNPDPVFIKSLTLANVAVV